MRFKSEEEKNTILFDFLGVISNYNGVDIKKNLYYINVSCENFID